MDNLTYTILSTAIFEYSHSSSMPKMLSVEYKYQILIFYPRLAILSAALYDTLLFTDCECTFLWMHFLAN